MTNTEKFLKLVKENPDLPIVPMVDEEVVADDCSTYWMGEWGYSEVTEYYIGKEKESTSPSPRYAVLSTI